MGEVEAVKGVINKSRYVKYRWIWEQAHIYMEFSVVLEWHFLIISHPNETI